MLRRISFLVLPAGFLVLASLFLTSCAAFTRGQARKADRVAYGIIEQKQQAALGEAQRFTIQNEEDPLLADVLARAGRIDLSSDVYTTPSFQLSLADSLAIAFTNSRDYQTRKEDLFLSALSLSTTRWDFGYIFNASASADLTRTDSGDRDDPNDGVERFGSGSFTAGVRKSLVTGAEVSLQFTKSFIHYLTGDPRESSRDSLSFEIVQPLLNGAGPLVAREDLRQAERDMIYAVRTFQRFQQSFVIDIASTYYNVLQQLDRLHNEYLNYQSALLDLDRARILSEAGRMSQLEVDQTRQRALVAENRWNNAQTDYLDLLDRFKLDLGLPINLDIGPDPSELGTLRDRGLVLPDIQLDEAVQVALLDRLDLMTAEDRTSDSVRKVKVAANDFLPNLDARYEFDTSSDVNNDTEFRLDFERNTNTIGLDLALPLDWTPRRNRYRRALVVLEQTRRRLEELHDTIIIEVRNAWRQLDRAQKNYEIQLVSVELAQRRVESAQLLMESGRASTRDLLEAQDALISSKNAVTESLVDYTIRRLEFWNSIERLKIDEKGMWYE
jgi:outer membrane protein TolC